MYYFIVNPASRTGKGSDVWKQVEAELIRQKITYEVYFTRYPRHSIEIAQELCAKAADDLTLVVLGGDGSANEVLNGIPAEALPRVTFAYLPTGSGNDLARGLGLSSEPVTALRQILSGKHVLDMDYGELHLEKGLTHRFAVSSGVGFDAAVCEEIMNSPIKKFLNKFHLGKLSYLVIAVKQLFTCRTADLTVAVDGQPPVTYKKVFFAAAMNQQCEGGGLKVAPQADPTDHLLSLCIIHDFPKIKAVVVLPALILGGRHTRFRGITLIGCRRAEITASRPLCTHTDGEYRGYHQKLSFVCSADTVRFPGGKPKR